MDFPCTSRRLLSLNKPTQGFANFVNSRKGGGGKMREATRFEELTIGDSIALIKLEKRWEGVE